MIKIHTFNPWMLAVFTACILSSCGGGGSSPPPQVTPPPATSTQSAVEAEAHHAAEHALRLKAEERLEEQQATTSVWQSLALILCVSATLLLVVGTALGSRARHEAQKP